MVFALLQSNEVSIGLIFAGLFFLFFLFHRFKGSETKGTSFEKKAVKREGLGKDFRRLKTIYTKEKDAERREEIDKELEQDAEKHEKGDTTAEKVEEDVAESEEEETKVEEEGTLVDEHEVAAAAEVEELEEDMEKAAKEVVEDTVQDEAKEQQEEVKEEQPLIVARQSPKKDIGETTREALSKLRESIKQALDKDYSRLKKEGGHLDLDVEVIAGDVEALKATVKTAQHEEKKLSSYMDKFQDPFKNIKELLEKEKRMTSMMLESKNAHRADTLQAAPGDVQEKRKADLQWLTQLEGLVVRLEQKIQGILGKRKQELHTMQDILQSITRSWNSFEGLQQKTKKQSKQAFRHIGDIFSEFFEKTPKQENVRRTAQRLAQQISDLFDAKIEIHSARAMFLRKLQQMDLVLYTVTERLAQFNTFNVDFEKENAQLDQTIEQVEQKIKPAVDLDNREKSISEHDLEKDVEESLHEIAAEEHVLNDVNNELHKAEEKENQLKQFVAEALAKEEQARKDCHRQSSRFKHDLEAIMQAYEQKTSTSSYDTVGQSSEDFMFNLVRHRGGGVQERIRKENQARNRALEAKRFASYKRAA